MNTENQELLIERFERRAERRDSRREMILALAGGAALAAAGSAAAQAVTDADVLNFALNLEYLEAQFYSFAANGVGLPAASLTGTGTQGAVRGGRQVTFTDPVVRQYAKEIEVDEIVHVNFLRSALGASAVAQPAIDISDDWNGALSAA